VEVLSSMTDFERGNALKFHLTLFPLEEYFVRLFFCMKWQRESKINVMVVAIINIHTYSTSVLFCDCMNMSLCVSTEKENRKKRNIATN